MTADVTNPYYWIYPLLGIAFFAVLYFLLRRSGARAQNAVLFFLLAANFVLHFLKLVFPPYTVMNREDALQTITPENVCAINTMLFPFLYLKKDGVGRDYMFYVGIISGISASWYPMSIEDAGPFDFDCIRYYFCHTVLWVVPLLMVVLGRHRLNYRRIGLVPLIYLLDLAVIVANEVLLVAVGLDEAQYILSLSHGNGGLAFGPYPEMEGGTALEILLALVPSVFKPSDGGGAYVPVLWQLFPVYIIGCPVGFLMCIFWERKRFFSDLERLFSLVELYAMIARVGRRVCRYRGGRVRIRGARKRKRRI